MRWVLLAALCALVAQGATITRLHEAYIGTSGGFQLKIGGSGFGSALAPPTVTVGGLPCKVLPYYTTSTLIVCETPPATESLLATGWYPKAKIVVRTSGGASARCVRAGRPRGASVQCVGVVRPRGASARCVCAARPRGASARMN